MECMNVSFEECVLLENRFRTVAPLNHGSFGMVFLADDLLTGSRVAIKCLTRSSSDPNSPYTIGDSSEELDFHSRLGYHRNIVNLLHSFETASHVFIVLEYCSMGDLYEAIRHDKGPLETENVRDFILQLIDAVEFMHNKGLYHRDIKPENLFLTSDGTVKLGDFGLATDESWSWEACVGSDRYMAPEQYEPGSGGYSPAKADIWSLGICILNVLFARNPFVTPSESDVLFSDYTHDRQSLFDIFPNMSQDTFEVLSVAMALDPAKRCLSALRAAVLRAISFTTDDETLDEFCTEDNDVSAKGLREPLRTPSLKGPEPSIGGSFPWAKALQNAPLPDARQLSIIGDNESYTEDLFPPSDPGVLSSSWYSANAGTSVNSTVDSALGASMQSNSLHPTVADCKPGSGPVPINSPRLSASIPAMSLVFGTSKPDYLSKSWSDLWEEEESENEEIALREQQKQHERSYSNESLTASEHGQLSVLAESTSSTINSRCMTPQLSRKPTGTAPIPTPRPRLNQQNENVCPWRSGGHSPRNFSSKRSPGMDKWVALGNKRRNFRPKDSDQPRLRKQRSMNLNWRRKDSDTVSHFPDRPFKKDHSKAYKDFPSFREWRYDPLRAVRPKPVSHVPCDHESDEEFDFLGGWHDLHI